MTISLACGEEWPLRAFAAPDRRAVRGVLRQAGGQQGVRPGGCPHGRAPGASTRPGNLPPLLHRRRGVSARDGHSENRRVTEAGEEAGREAGKEAGREAGKGILDIERVGRPSKRRGMG
jgi:hypothetical protein